MNLLSIGLQKRHAYERMVLILIPSPFNELFWRFLILNLVQYPCSIAINR